MEKEHGDAELFFTEEVEESEYPQIIVPGYMHDPKMTPERKLEKERNLKLKQAMVETRSGPADLWCMCGGKCVETGNPEEHVCCQEDPYAQIWIRRENLDCITDCDGFEAVLNTHVLTMTKHRLKRILADDQEKVDKLNSGSNQTCRHLAYINFRDWVCDGKKLGRGNRMVTPACVTKKVREMWPETNGVYTGYQARNADIDDL